MNKKVVLLHNNDIHGDFLPSKKGHTMVGGIALLSGFIKKTRKEEKNVIYAIAGDMFRGSVIDSEYKGISTIELINFLHPDVVTVGNHEVDYGIAHLLFLEKCAKFPIINANLYIKSNHARLFTPYKIIEVDGLNIMFIGILTDEVLSQTKSEAIIGSFIDLWEAKREIGVIIDNYKTTKIDCTVLLTHIGLQQDIELAKILDENWGVDLIVGAHTHSFMDEPVISNGIPIVQAGFGSGQIGRCDLEFDEKTRKIVDMKWSCLEVSDEVCQRDKVMDALLESYKSETDKKYQRIITQFSRELTHPSRYQETELGNLTADLLQKDSSFDIMFYASGAIRKKTMGPIVTYQDLQECYPYDGGVVMLAVSGKQLKTIMRHLLRDEQFVEGSHGEFYQVSQGFKVVLNKTLDIFEEFSLNGKHIKDDDMINIGVQDGYHYSGFSEFFGVNVEEVKANRKPKMVITSCSSIFEELLMGESDIEANIEGRLVVKY